MENLEALKMISQMDGRCYKNGTRANVHLFKLGFENCDPITTGLTRRPVLRFQGMKHRKLRGGGKAVSVNSNKMRYFTPEELPSIGDACFGTFTKGRDLRVSEYVNVAVIEGFNDPWMGW